MARDTKLKRLGRLSAAIGVLLLVVIGLAVAYRKSIGSYRQSAFVEAALRGNIPRMRLLLAAGANVDQPACESFLCPPPIVAAALADEPDAVDLLLNCGANVNKSSMRGQTALMVAAGKGRANTVKLLIAKGADVNAVSEEGTALQRAKRTGHFDVAELLVKAG